jgi:hypothetical protein
MSTNNLSCPLYCGISWLCGLPFAVLIFTRFAFDHISIWEACSIRRTEMWHILGPWLFLSIKCGDQIFNSHDLPLVFKGRGKTPPRWRQFVNYATNHEPIRQGTINVRKFPSQKLDLMSLFHNRAVIDHPIFVVLVINIRSGVSHSSLAIVNSMKISQSWLDNRDMIQSMQVVLSN